MAGAREKPELTSGASDLSSLGSSQKGKDGEASTITIRSSSLQHILSITTAVKAPTNARFRRAANPYSRPIIPPQPMRNHGTHAPVVIWWVRVRLRTQGVLARVHGLRFQAYRQVEQAQRPSTRRVASRRYGGQSHQRSGSRQSSGNRGKSGSRRRSPGIRLLAHTVFVQR